ncbi:MAG: hypothetical protein NZ934_02825, partial [Hadesarchaea archaeon]|nr:hypothetical protein [Hadesarchaea archaeon]
MRSKFGKALPLTLVLALVLAALIFCTQPEYTTASSATMKPAMVQLLPTDDSHVNEGTPDVVSDGGRRYNMYVGWDEQRFLSERIYLK